MIVRLKGHYYRCGYDGYCRFNSMIVRLKGLRTPKRPRRAGFQFYDSPIKSFSPPPCEMYRGGFNSMIVRLKGK